MPTTRNPRSRNIVVTFVVALGLVATGRPRPGPLPRTPRHSSPPRTARPRPRPLPCCAPRASDPDGGDLQVTFEGRKAGATVPGTPADPFTIVAIPDTQNYTYHNRQGTINQQTQWVVATASALNTAFVVQLGDLVSEYDNLTQWGHTSTALKVLDDANVPNSVVPGNHDFNNTTGAVGRTTPTSRLPLRAGGVDTVDHELRRLPRPEPVRRRPGRPHELRQLLAVHRRRAGLPRAQPRVGGAAVRPRLGGSGARRPPRPHRRSWSPTASYVDGSRRTRAERPGGTSAADAVVRLRRDALLRSGSCSAVTSTTATRARPAAPTTTRCGQPVHQIMTDYQDRANGGDGWLRYYTFDPAAGHDDRDDLLAQARPLRDGRGLRLHAPVPLGPAGAGPVPADRDRAVASGATATARWAGLAPTPLYEWRARSSDGTTTDTSPDLDSAHARRRPDIVDDTFTRTRRPAAGARPTAGRPGCRPRRVGVLGRRGERGAITTPPGQERGRDARCSARPISPSTTECRVTPSPGGSGAYVVAVRP